MEKLKGSEISSRFILYHDLENIKILKEMEKFKIKCDKSAQQLLKMVQEIYPGIEIK